MPDTGVLVAELVEDLPRVSRPGAGRERQRTDIDVALEQLPPGHNGYMKLIDYKVDRDGNAVEPKTAAQRASARVQSLRKRGYTKEEGWQFNAIEGILWAKNWGPGNHPAKETSNGQAGAPDSIPAPPTR